jgi:hypothetical protein
MRLRDLAFVAAGAAALSLIALFQINPAAAGIGLGIGLATSAILWLRATWLARKAASLFDHVAEQLGMVCCDTSASASECKMDEQLPDACAAAK